MENARLKVFELLKGDFLFISEIISQMNEREMLRRENERKAKNELQAVQEAERNRLK